MTDATTAEPDTTDTFTFGAAQTACRDVLDALTDAGFDPGIEYLSGGCAAICVVLHDGSAVLISDTDARLPLSDAPRAPWWALHYPGVWDGYPGDEEPVTVYVGPGGVSEADDTAAMLTAVTAYSTAGQATDRDGQSPA
ncbi:hypothetical protein [Catenulispora pinisilvae]|uniref:hypothetical protein n=1 Tax=Catenulispora pinisilvae TaxID=2705253 RepID=UPI001890BEE9|nr:hypothetical protein [Catenulispora pinisilvae]